MEYFYKAMQRDAGGVVDEAPPNQCAEAMAAAPASGREAAANSNVFVVPPAVDRLFAVRSGEMTTDRVQALEQYRALRSRVLHHLRLHNMRSLMVTSAIGSEGKTVTSVNLAFALSQVEGVRVLLVDADLRNPMVAKVLGMPATRGLQDYLQKPEPIAGLAWRVNPRLAIMPSVGTIENTTELLHSGAIRQFVDEAKLAYDVLIFDAAPLCPIADARVLSAYLDGVVLCIRADRTPLELVSSAVAMVRERIVGAVLVGSQKVRPGYGYGYNADSGKQK
jgi:capsular exopolysaccharide synthesis family protein